MRMENMDRSWGLIGEEIGLAAGIAVPSLPIVNRVSHDAREAYYTPELEAMVRRRYAEDFDRLGYD